MVKNHFSGVVAMVTSSPSLLQWSSNLKLDRLEDRMVPASFQGLGFAYFPQALSVDGRAIVGSDGTQAFRWMAATGLVVLGNLPGGNYATAYGVSADGAVVVGSGQNATSHQEAFRWTSTNGMVGLGTIAGGTTSQALGVSANGSVVVGYSSNATNDEAFRWTASGMVGLGLLPGGTFSRATAVSPDGSIVVGYSDSNSGTQAFQWTALTGMVGLGQLAGTTYSQANGTSADGSAIVGYCGTFSPQAFRWTAAGGMAGLGFLPGCTTSRAYSVSGDGTTVVGYSGPPEGPPFNFHAFHWTVAAGMLDLRDELATTYGLSTQLAGWYLTGAEGCSGDGQVIVGYGFHETGNTETWMARLTSPAQVVGVQINDGATQRSRVTSLKVTFDSTVILPPLPANAFELKRQSDNAIVSLSASAIGNTVSLSFTGGPIEFGSLADGRYTLTVHSSLVNYGDFDGNGDGTPGDDYTRVGTPANGLFRLFGDADGNGTVNSVDFAAFRSVFGMGPSIFDFSGDGQTDANDFAEFRRRFGVSI
jgi:probable HAF family extracellular repeat protein